MTLSLYLFIIVPNALSMMVLIGKDRGLLEGFLMGRDRTRVSRIQFAYDAMYFFGSNPKSCEILSSS